MRTRGHRKKPHYGHSHAAQGISEHSWKYLEKAGLPRAIPPGEPRLCRLCCLRRFARPEGAHLARVERWTRWKAPDVVRLNPPGRRPLTITTPANRLVLRPKAWFISARANGPGSRLVCSSAGQRPASQVTDESRPQRCSRQSVTVPGPLARAGMTDTFGVIDPTLCREALGVRGACSRFWTRQHHSKSRAGWARSRRSRDSIAGLPRPGDDRRHSWASIAKQVSMRLVVAVPAPSGSLITGGPPIRLGRRE